MSIEQTRKEIKKYIEIKKEQKTLSDKATHLEKIKNEIDKENIDPEFIKKVEDLDSKIKTLNAEMYKENIFIDTMESALQSLENDEIELLLNMHGNNKISKRQLANHLYTTKSTLYRKENRILEKIDSELSVIRELRE
ncbi:MAG: hypothetical protein E7C89_03545 [Anaerococcus sp.]|uniref:hypothetical protein n=1 Tax=Anaerococcus sp. TaxID=1872515 RepID=UPI00290300BA|nr:hypothetical protein [Anaerococcus sp.]MDU2565656.1 hypothetical protein [Anaerococcus sp.]